MAISMREAAERAAKMKQRIAEILPVAAAEAKIVAMERSPHRGDTGVSLTTGNLAAHWDARVERQTDGFVFYLTNDVPYASYVNDGHRMSKHFVPWLYVDPSGGLRREKPTPGEPVFGIMVGTKTRYVRPVPMVEPAVESFKKTISNHLKER